MHQLPPLKCPASAALRDLEGNGLRSSDLHARSKLALGSARLTIRQWMPSYDRGFAATDLPSRPELAISQRSPIEYLICGGRREWWIFFTAKCLE
jgi:hypothetical protein